MIRSFIQISSLALTLEAAFFLAKGNIGLSANTIAELSSMKLGYNPDLIQSFAQQRADTWVGVAFLLAAFVLQMWSSLWPMRWGDFDVHRGAAAYALIFCAVVGFGGYFCAREVASYTAIEVKRILDARQGASITPEPTPVP